VMQIRMVEPHKPATYVFEGLRPLEFDAQGRVIAASAWLVQCGPPEPPPAGGSDHLYRPTKRPLPGLTMKGPDCVARDPETVLRATRASETWPQNSGEPAARIHWVRDGVN